MKAFVTGSTGFIGSHLVDKLIENSFEVKVLVRHGSKTDYLNSLAIELVEADILDYEAIKEVMRGCDVLFHLAAKADFSSNKEDCFKINYQGTKNVLESASINKYKMVVYTSTRGTISCAQGEFINETGKYSSESSSDDYVKSKIAAEKFALEMNQKGLPVIILNPTAVIGPRDVRPSSIGNIIIKLLTHKMLPFYVNGKLNFVDVRNVVDANILALSKGNPGERYIIGNKNITMADFISELRNITDDKHLMFKIPYPIALFMTYLYVFICRIFCLKPMFTIKKLHSLRRNNFCNNSKSINELGLAYRNFEETLKDTVVWFKENGYLK